VFLGFIFVVVIGNAFSGCHFFLSHVALNAVFVFA